LLGYLRNTGTSLSRAIVSFNLLKVEPAYPALNYDASLVANGVETGSQIETPAKRRASFCPVCQSATDRRFVLPYL
jgi:hypothetical protein